MAVLSIARFLHKSPALGHQLRDMAVLDSVSPISVAARRMSVIANQFPYSHGEERSRSSSRTDRLPVSLFAATSATAFAAYSISAHPVIGGAKGVKGKYKLTQSLLRPNQII